MGAADEWLSGVAAWNRRRGQGLSPAAKTAVSQALAEAGEDPAQGYRALAEAAARGWARDALERQLRGAPQWVVERAQAAVGPESEREPEREAARVVTDMHWWRSVRAERSAIQLREMQQFIHGVRRTAARGVSEGMQGAQIAVAEIVGTYSQQRDAAERISAAVAGELSRTVTTPLELVERAVLGYTERVYGDRGVRTNLDRSAVTVAGPTREAPRTVEDLMAAVCGVGIGVASGRALALLPIPLWAGVAATLVTLAVGAGAAAAFVLARRRQRRHQHLLVWGQGCVARARAECDLRIAGYLADTELRWREQLRHEKDHRLARIAPVAQGGGAGARGGSSTAEGSG